MKFMTWVSSNRMSRNGKARENNWYIHGENTNIGKK